MEYVPRVCILIFGILLKEDIRVACDVSHLFYGFNEQTFESNLTPSSTTTEAFFFPEIIINRKTKSRPYSEDDVGRLNYYLPPSQSLPHPPPILIPVPPSVQQPPGYIPPIENSNAGETGYKYIYPASAGASTTSAPTFVSPSESDFQETPDTSAPGATYLPPKHSDRSLKDFNRFSNSQKNQIRLQLNEMRCAYSQSDGFFKSRISVESLLPSIIPIVENDMSDTRCDLKFEKNVIIVNIAVEDFVRCGIFDCQKNNLCLKIRFPSIRGMKTFGDSLLTLQCKIQERIASKTHSITMGISNPVQARSLGTVAHGGIQQPFKTFVELLRKSDDGFTKALEQNGVVQIGEELLLRAHVRSGDGWNFTRLSDVSLQRFSTSGELMNAATLVKSTGCINPEMESICPLPPIYDPPLGHRLHFKAVMFQGMKNGDEIQMSIKISACIDQHDCSFNRKLCEHSGLVNHRRRRHINGNSTSNSIQFSEIAIIPFRVETPHRTSTASYRRPNPLFLIGGVLGLISLIAVTVYQKFKSQAI